jgi:hypothetical protein
MALPLDDLVSWLTANTSGATILANWSPPEPDAVVVVSGGSGGTPVMDGAFEPMHIHVRCRDTTDAAAEATALAIHALFCVQDGTVQMGETRVLSVVPISGPPMFLLRDTQERTTYIATYSAMTPTAAAT